MQQSGAYEPGAGKHRTEDHVYRPILRHLSSAVRFVGDDSRGTRSAGSPMLRSPGRRPGLATP